MLPQQSDDTATDEQRDNERIAEQSEALGSEFDCRLGQFGFLVELVLLSVASIERLKRQIVVSLIECALTISQPNLVELRSRIGVLFPEFDGIFQAEHGAVEAIVVSLLDRLGPQYDRLLGKLLATFDIGPFFLNGMDRGLQIIDLRIPIFGVGFQSSQGDCHHRILAVGRLDHVALCGFGQGSMPHLLIGVLGQPRMMPCDDLKQDST